MSNRFHTFAIADQIDAGHRIEIACDASLDEGAIIRTITDSSPLSSGVEYFLGLEHDEVEALNDALDAAIRNTLGYQQIQSSRGDGADDDYQTLLALARNVERLSGYMQAGAPRDDDDGERLPLSRDEALALASASLRNLHGCTGAYNERGLLLHDSDTCPIHEDGREYLVVRYDVTDLDEAQRGHLETYAVVQGEGGNEGEYPSVNVKTAWEGCEQPGEQPLPQRQVLVHLNVTTDANDPRTANQIADDIQAGLEVAGEDSPLSNLDICVPLAEEI